MPENESRQKPFVYKLVRWSAEPNAFTLQEALQKALWGKARTIEKRLLRRGPDDEEAVLLDYRGSTHGVISGSFVNYTAGVAAQVLEINKNAEELKYREVRPARSQTNEEREFLDGILFFVSHGDHLILAPSRGLGAQDFEAYLNWLLRETDLQPEEAYLMLANRPPLKKAALLKKATGISLKAPMDFEAKAVTTHAGRREARYVPVGASWEALKAFIKQFGSHAADWPSELERKGITEAKNIQIELLLHWRHHRPGDEFELIDRVANEFRHVDQTLDYKIQVPGGTVTKDDFVVKKLKSVKCRYGLPFRDDIHLKMKKWLDELIENGQIPV